MVKLDDLVVDIETTALIVVDVQKDFCVSEPGFAYFDRQENKDGHQGDLKPIQDTIDGYLIPFIVRARESGLHIVYLQSAYGKGQHDDMPRLCLEGTEGWKLYKVGPDPSNPTSPREIVFPKDAHDPFNGTNGLDEYLRARGITQLLIAGVTTDNCVAATTYVSLGRGYNPVVLEYAVSTAGYKRETAHVQKLNEFAAHPGIMLVNSVDVSFKPA